MAPGTGSSIGSPVGWTRPYSKFWVIVAAVPNTFGVSVPTEIVSVAIVEAKAKRIRHSIKTAFKFNLPPPFLFFPLRI